MPGYETLGTGWMPQPLFSLQLRSAEAFDALNERNGFAIDFLARSSRDADVSVEGGQCLTMGLWLTKSATGFTSRPKVHNDVFTIRFVTNGWMLRRHRSEEHVGRAGHAMMVPFQDMQSATASSNFEGLSGIIAPNTLIASHRALDGGEGEDLPLFEPIAAIDTMPMRSFMLGFRRLHERLARAPIATDILFPLLEEILAYQLLSAWPRRGSAPAGLRPPSVAVVRRVREYVEAHLGTPIRLADLAEVGGISVRALQLAFKRELGLTPGEFIQERRLQRVHDDLGRAESATLTIANIARRWGFDHASDFGQRYRRRYGCTPSETRQRVARRD